MSVRIVNTRPGVLFTHFKWEWKLRKTKNLSTLFKWKIFEQRTPYASVYWNEYVSISHSRMACNLINFNLLSCILIVGWFFTVSPGNCMLSYLTNATGCVAGYIFMIWILSVTLNEHKPVCHCNKKMDKCSDRARQVEPFQKPAHVLRLCSIYVPVVRWLINRMKVINSLQFLLEMNLSTDFVISQNDPWKGVKPQSTYPT